MYDQSLQEIISTAEVLQQACQGPWAVDLLKRKGVKPSLTIPSQDDVVDSEVADILGKDLTSAVYRRLHESIAGQRVTAMTIFESTIHNVGSMESIGGMSDWEVENQICEIFEVMFEEHCRKMGLAIKEAVCGPHRRSNLARKGCSFANNTLSILEAAYARTKILSAAETAIIAEAAGITPHQVRTWFQNKRNRGSRRNPSGSANRLIQSLPKRAQHIKLETSPLSSSPVPVKRQVRGLPKRAQAQVSHNAPNSSILDSSLGNLPFPDESSSIGNGQTSGSHGERMNRSPSLTSTISNSSEIANGGFISPFDAQNIPQIAIEWGTGTLNVPVDILEGGKLPIFNFTPPSPLNLNFNPLFNPNPNSVNNDMNSMFGGQVYDTPISTSASFNPFAQQPDLDLAAGLESIESLLTSALSDPSSFEQFSTLAASPQISLDSLSPRSDTLESIPSIASASASNIGSPSWLAGNGEEGLAGGFFEALEGMLASQTNGQKELGSPFSESVYGGNMERKASTSSQISGIISAEEGIDLSYIAGIPLPPSPTNGLFYFTEFVNVAGPAHSQPINEQITFTTDHTSSSFTENDFLTQPPSGMCTPSSTTSVYPLITPNTASESHQEALVEIDQNQWNWMSGVLPFDIVGMEVEMMEFGNDTKATSEEAWMMGSGSEEGMMAL